MNIITIRASFIKPAVAEKFGLVPNTHAGGADWYKIVVMDHVEIEHLEAFIDSIKVQVAS